MQIPYGEGYQAGRLPQGLTVYEIAPREVAGVTDAAAEMHRALENPIGNRGIEELRGAQKVVIVVSDLTRPVPNAIILPVLLEKLNAIGIRDEQVTVLVGAGLHRPASPDEFPLIVGPEVAARIKVISHDASATGMLGRAGTSSRGTPIWINRHYLEADGRILVGMIDPHQIVGYSAGAKSLVIGCGGEATICANHARLVEPGATLGRVEGNPAREDIDEIGGLVGIDLIVNVVLNNRKEIVRVVAGHYLAAHRAGVAIARKVSEVPVPGVADLAIVSPGGYPKDINLYQAQKGLYHATPVVKKGGIIILCAECREGAGEDRFIAGMKAGNTPEEVMASFHSREFQMGFHKAFLWCRSLVHARVILVSDGVDEELARVMMVRRAPGLQAAIDLALQGLPGAGMVAVLPKANSTIPVL
ncbi:nickel-dependent lactate racemase [Moorella sulfitireducens (nom. illeg.)]|uniref:nickel-dependent lactate racemase n=1 Tax=Neomoorella sulfitireducens TaxID=2972948 RepID=UPI0021ACBE66